MKEIIERCNRTLLERHNWQLSFKKSGTSSEPPDWIRDFEHLEQLVDETINGVPVAHELLGYRMDGEPEQERFILRTNIAFQLRFCAALMEQIQEKGVFSWEQSRNDKHGLFIASLWKQNVYSLIVFYSLILRNLEFQAIGVLRAYIESSAILYLSLIDFSFINKFVSLEIPREEYTKLWFKKLKPSSVKKQIKQLHEKWAKENARQGISTIGLSAIEKPFINSEFVQELYERTNDYVHFSPQALFENTYDSEKCAFYLGLNHQRGHPQVISISDLSLLSSILFGMIEMSIAGHFTVIPYNKYMGDWSALVLELSVFRSEPKESD